MNSQQRLFEIAKKLIIFSGKKSILSQAEKKKIVPQLERILGEVEEDTSLMAKKIKKFLNEILSDIENNRKIDIDFISEDNYVENFLLSEQYVSSYNDLLTHSDYSAIIKNTEKGNYIESFKTIRKLNTNSKKIMKDLPVKKFSELLLIINIFEISNILKHYRTLYIFLVKHGDINSAKLLLDPINSIQSFHSEVHKQGLKSLQDETIESKYMMCDIKRNKLSFLPISVAKEGDIKDKYIKVLLSFFTYNQKD